MTDIQMAPSPPPIPKAQQSTKGTPRNSARAMVQSTNGNEGNLPGLRSSDQLIDRSRPLPTSLQSDFLPDDVLFALTQPPPVQEQLGPVTRGRNLAVTGMPSRKPPNNVWNHKRREKFKHLIDNTSCACGAGKDISFLYDIPQTEDFPGAPDVTDESAVRKPEEEAKVLALPDTLIPEEYHVVRNKGVMGLEFHEDKYACQAKDHEEHLVSFPSMKPNSRYEVLQLKKTLEGMLDKAGIDNEDIEVKGPTQMHNLLELIKKEQDIYNVIFHEMIRQVSVECIERGKLLSDLRTKYSDLLNRVPRQIKSLHEEVMAQRALDRRLTEELMRFRTTIGVLTSELTEVKEHDTQVTAEAHKAQEDLKSALAESQKNASLLAEYHDLYELQRMRLEKLVKMLSEEKELWSTAAYSLALKVTQEKCLNTAKRLQVSEKTWSKLASHFAILLSDQDTIELTKLQCHVDAWREMLEKFTSNLERNETEMTASLSLIQGELTKYRTYFQQKIMNKDGQFVRLPKSGRIKEIHNDLKRWTRNIQEEVDKFSGDSMLSGEEMLGKIKLEMDGWTECALTVFARHKEGGKTYNENDTMIQLNTSIERLLQQHHLRNDGENGVAKVLIQLSNAFEQWDMKLTQASMGTPIGERDWQVFYELLDEWKAVVEVGISLIGTTQKEEDREQKKPHKKIDVSDVFRLCQKWLQSTTNGVDSEDAKLVEQVTTLHTEMVKWMVHVLLRLAPDFPTNSKESREAALLGSATLPQIQESANSLFNDINQFSKFVVACCNGIVMDRMQKKMDNLDDDADMEYRDLKRLKIECDEWIFTAKLLLCELTGESPEGLGKPPKFGTEWEDRPATQQSQISYHDKEKLQSSDEVEHPAVAIPSTVREADGEQLPEVSAEGGETADTSTQDKVADEALQIAPTEDTTVQEDTQPQEVAVVEQAPAESGGGAESSADQTTPTEGVEPTGEIVQETVDGKDGEQAETVEEEQVEPTLEIIGFDSNTHIKRLEETIPSDIVTKPPTPSEIRAETPNTKLAYEALTTVNDLQTQLLDTEERAMVAEEKASQLDLQLKEAMEKVRSLERRLASEDDKDPFDAVRPSPTPEAQTSAPVPVVEKEKEAEPEKQAKKPKKGSAKKRLSKP